MQNTNSTLKSMDLPFPPLSVYLLPFVWINKPSNIIFGKRSNINKYIRIKNANVELMKMGF